MSTQSDRLANLPTYVYRCYDAEGRPLYIGASSDYRARMATHKSASEWYDDFHRLEVEVFPTRREAMDAERAAIIRERPTHNRQYLIPQIRSAAQRENTGRPSGLLINPEAARFLLGDRPQSWWGRKARVAPSNISTILTGQTGVSRAVADRLAEALGAPTGVLFPQVSGFATAVHNFTASGAA